MLLADGPFISFGESALISTTYICRELNEQLRTITTVKFY